MAKQRMCATCGHRYSFSMPACPHCEAERTPSRNTPTPCDEPGCVRVATVFLADRKRCSEHFAEDRREPQVSTGEGYREFKRKLEELRRA